MERFYAILLAHFRTICKRVTRARQSGKAYDSDWLQQIDALVLPLFELSEMMPKFAGKYTRQEVVAMRESLLAKTDSDEGSSRLPEVHQLLRLKLISTVFPTSDFRHNVITPCLLFMCECLSRVPLQGGRDVASALFLAGLVLHYVQLSNRLVPELVSFLGGLLAFGGLPLETKQEKPVNFLPAAAIWKGLFEEHSKGKGKGKEKKGNKTSNGSSNAPSFGGEKSAVTTLDLTVLFCGNDDEVFDSSEFKVCLCSCPSTEF